MPAYAATALRDCTYAKGYKVKLGILGLAGVAIGLLAQAAPTTAIPGLPNIDLSSLTATGLLGLYALYVTVKAIPRMDENHRADLAKVLADWAAERKATAEQHKGDMEKAWARLDAIVTRTLENNTRLMEMLENERDKG